MLASEIDCSRRSLSKPIVFDVRINGAFIDSNGLKREAVFYLCISIGNFRRNFAPGELMIAMFSNVMPEELILIDIARRDTL